MLGAALSVGPWLVRDARSSSGAFNITNCDDELPDPTIPDFERKTGISVNSTPFSQNEEQINKLQATGGEGLDLFQPTRDRAPKFKDLELLQPMDENKLARDNLRPAMAETSAKFWIWECKLYHTAHCWGSEAISWRTDLTTLDYKTLSYGTLWKDEDRFKNLYDLNLAFAIARKPWTKQFWDSGDNTESGLLESGVVIGQTWDGPPISLRKQGKPVSYMAHQESAISWLDGWAMPTGAKNIDQAHESIAYVHTKEASAKVAEGSGYNRVVKGADTLLSAQAKQIFSEAYPGDALTRLWPRPAEPSWYADLRTQYAEKFKAAWLDGGCRAR